MIDRMFSGLSGPQRLLALLAVLLASTALLAFVTGGLVVMVAAMLGLNLLLWITRAIWLPADAGRTRLRVVSMGVVLGVATLLAASPPQLAPWLIAASAELGLGALPEWLLPLLSRDRLLAVAIMAFTLIGVFIVNWLARDTSAMKAHPEPIDAEFPEKTYREKLAQFSEVLRSHLRDTNLKTRWSEAYFTPLEAEVEIVSQGQSKRRITDLMSAIRGDHRSRVFLVLGDPGSGKSVALRTLAMELLDEVPRTGRVPVYVNLKEWEADRPWSEGRPPEVADLQAFILTNLKERCDVFGAEFLDKYFRRMLENDRFFFLLDSFDEIPGVLDVAEGSWLIERLSWVISTFLVGAGQTRGVLASRLFRRPRLTINDVATLEIRPFDEARIAKTLKHSEYVDDALVQRLFRDRPGLVPIARNPFTAALIQAYATETQGQLPDTQLQLYQSYIDSRLRAADERLQREGLDREQVLDCCIAIASTLYDDPTMGLEAQLAVIAERLPDQPVAAVVKLLAYARLMRLGGAEAQQVSFVHRRFHEFFVAQAMQRDPSRIEVDSIPTDSQWRDALVLYCEVAPEAQATAIAEFCWEEIRPLADAGLDTSAPRFLRAVHSLRFLRDAFRSRTACIERFRQQLAGLIEREITLKDGALPAKIALESSGLLTPNELEPVVVGSMETGDPWLQETALRACRHLPRLGHALEFKLLGYIATLPRHALLGPNSAAVFSLRLSNAFSRLYFYARWRAAELRLQLVGALVAVILTPQVFLTAGLTWLWFAAIFWLLCWAQRDCDWVRLTLPVLFWLVLVVALIVHLDGFVPRVFDGSQADHVPNTSLLESPIPFAPNSEPILILPLVVALAASCLVLPPWSFLYFLGSAAWLQFRVLHDKGVGHLVRALGLILWFLMMLVLFDQAERLTESYPLPDSIASAGKSVFIAVLALYVAARILMASYLSGRDWLIFRPYSRVVVFTRKEIEGLFGTLRTASFRLRLVEVVSRMPHPPSGAWSNGVPYIKEDPASTRLAQLEEQWLGISSR